MMSSVHVVIVLAIALWLLGLLVVLGSIAVDARRAARAADRAADALTDDQADPDAGASGGR